MKPVFALFLLPLAFVPAPSSARAEVVEIRPVVLETDGVERAEYRSGDSLVGRSTEGAPAGVELKLPGAEWAPVRFHERTERDGAIELGPEKVGPLTLRWRFVQKTPSLVERTLEVKADAARQFTVAFPLDLTVQGAFASFSGPVTDRVLCDTVRGAAKTETFPVAMVLANGRVFGIIADSPGLWENRCQILLDPPARRLAVLTGDGRDPYPLVIKPPEDARDTYYYMMDGWQSLVAGETRRFTTWVFASPARHHYDAQVAAHLAVANAKGWNGSAVEAILRNTSLYLLRRNLARDADDRPRDGRYIFVSGPGYGWKQWVTDGFYTALGLDDPEKTVESNRAVFWTRMDYEDNAQYYLIWAVLMRRAGGTVNESMVRKAYEFIRHHEKDGLYVPPPLPGAPNPKGWKTYHDVLPYDEDDSPASNQGFHCGALVAAKELGLDVTDQDIARAIAGYRSLFNTERGFMPTSRKQRDTLGQDTLYGATLTYAVFGKKLLTDEQVLTHHRTSEKVKTPYGLRVISQADGSLLPGHSGVYCYGGSWFLNDAANYLLAGVHGLPAGEVDALLAERIAREIVYAPAFNESISTVDGHPHGHILYSWNSGYWWLRKEIRARLGHTGNDPVERAVDARLGVIRERGQLRLDPGSNTGGRLFFTSLGKTCLMQADGTGLRTLELDAPNQASWQPGAFLPDGRVLLLSMEPRRDGPGRPFEEYYHQTPTHVWAYDLERKTLEELATKERLAPFYAPQLLLHDGRILMQVIRTRPGQTMNMNLDGTDARAFTGPDEGLPYGFSLSPDGKRVAFHLASPEGYQIWTSDLLGANRVRVAAHPEHLYFGPSWSPDGQWLVYQDCRFTTDPGHDWSDVCVNRPDGSAHRVLTENQAMWFGATYGNPRNRGGGSNVPAWTHDGQILFPRRLPGSKVAWEFQSQRPDTDHFNRDYKPDLAWGGTEICRLDPTTGAVTVLTTSVPPVWDFRCCESPDGRRIAFCRAETGGVPALWVMGADGSNPRLLTRGLDDQGADHPRWLPNESALQLPR